jgi:hypothetical protein
LAFLERKEYNQFEPGADQPRLPFFSTIILGTALSAKFIVWDINNEAKQTISSQPGLQRKTISPQITHDLNILVSISIVCFFLAKYKMSLNSYKRRLASTKSFYGL